MPFRSLCLTLLLLTTVLPLRAQQRSHDEEHRDGAMLHFTHPLVTESVSPDTKLRLDHVYSSPGSSSEFELEGEYAFHPAVSVEAGVHYDLSGTRLGETHVLFKFANYAFAEQGFLLGYGIGFGLPTGGAVHDHDAPDHGQDHDAHASLGSDIYEVEPYLNAGVKRGAFELAGWARFAIPTNHERQSEVETEFRFDLSTLYHINPRFDLLLELNGASGLGGAASGETATALAPGLRFRPLLSADLVAALGVAVPLHGQRSFDSRIIFSLFYHF